MILKHRLIKIIGITILLIGNNLIFAQIPVITTPKPATFQNYSNFVNPQSTNPNFLPNYNQTNIDNRTQINNQMIMQEVQYYEQLRLQQQQIINDAVNTNNTISYELPSFAGETGTENFYNAFNEINSMLNGSQPLDLKRAVFLTENAFLDNRLNYNDFDGRIKSDVSLAKIFMKQSKYSKNENLAKNLAIFQFMVDTTSYYNYSAEGTAYHLPYSYDFNDFFGRDDWTKMFVTKLLYSKSGQCHSLPLLYLIYTQEIGAEAYLTYSPSHTYIRIKDDNNWFNLELTNGMITTDAAIMASGFIKTEAIKNQIYMDTISTKQTVATCLIDLAQGYYRKFGYDNFMLQCADTVLKYSPNSINAYMLKADYYTLLNHHVGRQLPKVNSLEEVEIMLVDYPKAKEIRDTRNELYETIDNLGYAEMPQDEYQKWLKSVSEQAYKQEHQTKILFIQNLSLIHI